MKLQLSSALAVPSMDHAAAELLRRFDDGVYLHQVVEQGPGGLTRYLDLPEAFGRLARRRRAWAGMARALPRPSVPRRARSAVSPPPSPPCSTCWPGSAATASALTLRSRPTPGTCCLRSFERAARRRDLPRAGLGAGPARGMTPSIALRLGRVSNLPTVWTNVLAGVALAGASPWQWAVLPAALGLSLAYLGGMYLNDAFDSAIDARERPSRPIPSGAIDANTVFALGLRTAAGRRGGAGGGGPQLRRAARGGGARGLGARRRHHRL